jgi:hypothetical protein
MTGRESDATRSRVTGEGHRADVARTRPRGSPALQSEAKQAMSPRLRATVEMTAALLKRRIERQLAPAAARTVGTRDHEAIRRWAERCGAEPATGQATASGPAMVDVNDGGACIRFNFPGAAPFRPIPWVEWFDEFERDRLVFVFEEQQSRRPSNSSRYLLIDERQWHLQISER